MQQSIGDRDAILGKHLPLRGSYLDKSSQVVKLLLHGFVKICNWIRYICHMYFLPFISNNSQRHKKRATKAPPGAPASLRGKKYATKTLSGRDEICTTGSKQQ